MRFYTIKGYWSIWGHGEKDVLYNLCDMENKHTVNILTKSQMNIIREYSLDEAISYVKSNHWYAINPVHLKFALGILMRYKKDEFYKEVLNE